MVYVDLETARQARGMRLVVAASVPSPWSEAAKGILHVKGIPFVAHRCDLRDPPTRAWTGVHNVPVAMYDDEPPRSHWADILALAQRLDDTVPLVPADPEGRVRLHGLAHEICSEGGLLWSVRLVLIEQSLRSKGERVYPLKVAEHLAGKYGYAPDRVPRARQRIADVFAILLQQLRRSQTAGHPYLLGDRLTALDIYAATALAVFVPQPDALCPLVPLVRKIFDDGAEVVRDLVPPELQAHRDLVYQRHLELPVAL